jgi:hypothetical protein
VPEPTNIEPESLSNLFVMRSVYEISTMEDERLNEAYWLSNPITDEVDVEQYTSPERGSNLQLVVIWRGKERITII